MKKISLTLFAALLFAATTFKASAQQEQSRNVSGFNSISSGGSFDVHVKIDGTESLKLSGETAILNEIETVVENGRLNIRYKKSHEWTSENYGKVDVYVSAKSLSAITLGGAGIIKVDGALTGNDVKLTIGGSGNITATVKTESLHISIGGAGSVKLEGHADDARISIGGSGTLSAKGLKIGTADVSIGGSGNAHIDVDKSISAHIAGSGNLVYSGTATLNDVRTTGSARIVKAGE